MPEERSSRVNIIKQMVHREMLKFIRTIELPYQHNKLLDITVEEEHKRRKTEENRISRYN